MQQTALFAQKTKKMKQKDVSVFYSANWPDKIAAIEEGRTKLLLQLEEMGYKPRQEGQKIVFWPGQAKKYFADIFVRNDGRYMFSASYFHEKYDLMEDILTFNFCKSVFGHAGI